MFVEGKVCYSALFTNLVGWHAGAVSFPPSDVILAQLACPLSDAISCLHSGITNLSLYKHWSHHSAAFILAGLEFPMEHPNLLFHPIFKTWWNQGILKGEVSLYHWPPVWLVWNQLYDYWQFLFLFSKQTNPNQSNRRSIVQWYFPL